MVEEIGCRIDSGACKIDSDMFGCFRVKLILPLQLILLDARFVDFDSRIDSYTQV